MIPKESLLSIDNMNISVQQKSIKQVLVKNLSLELGYENLGLVGASGSGKSLTLKAMLGLLTFPFEIQSKRFIFNHMSLQNAAPKRWETIRGQQIAMIMQDAKFCLNPLMKIRTQLMECYSLYYKDDTETAYTKSVALLESLQIEFVHKVLDSYPHELSGGMAQRIMIGMMLSGKPKLLLADEPTSALDPIVRLEVVRLLKKFLNAQKMGLIFVSHDIRLVASFCDRIIVMQHGTIVDSCEAQKIDDSTHPYTQALLKCSPRLKAPYAIT